MLGNRKIVEEKILVDLNQFGIVIRCVAKEVLKLAINYRIAE